MIYHTCIDGKQTSGSSRVCERCKWRFAPGGDLAQEKIRTQAARIAELEAAFGNALLTIHLVMHKDNRKCFENCEECKKFMPKKE